MWKFPDIEEQSNIRLTHWSYFEPWDSYRNYLVAKEHCGLEEKEEGQEDTFTNFAQNDQALYVTCISDVPQIWIRKGNTRCRNRNKRGMLRASNTSCQNV